MSNQADIRDIQILGDLKTAFGRFGEDVLQILAALEKQFEEIQEQLEERQEHWQRQVDAAQEAVYEARRSLNECESEPDDEEGNSPDCSSEADQVSDAERDLAGYEENLETVKQWRHRVESQIADFQNDMHRLSNLASSRASSVQAFLANTIEILERYVGGISFANSGGQAIHTLTSDRQPALNSTAKTAPELQGERKNDTIPSGYKGATFGTSTTTDYKDTFFVAYPYLRGQVVVHHAVEQQVLVHYPGIVTESEINSLENLRGIPNQINEPFHLSLIRSEWNEFYRQNQTVTKEQFLEKATEIDAKYGHNYLPPTENLPI